jgi:tripartite-type tricarboxylate transporter receptor subunit TctC
MMKLLKPFFCIACALWATSAAAQQAYPTKPIHVIVAYAAGGTGDVFARLIADKLRGALGQSVVVENRPGGTGIIGTQYVARAAADGYTLLLGQTGEIAINKGVMKNIGYDPDRDLTPIILVGNVPLALAVPAASPFNSVKDLIESARKEPGKTAFASSGTATPGHLAGETLALRTQSKLVHVPYKGAGPALTDLIGGHVAFFFSGMPAAMPHAKSGKLRILAVSTAKRTPGTPEIPTIAEQGVPGFDFSLWGGFFAPAGTPVEIISRLNREINQILALPEIRNQLLNDGAEVNANTPEQFAAFVHAEIAKYSQIIQQTGVTIE